MARQIHVAIHFGDQGKASDVAAQLGLPRIELPREVEANINQRRLQDAQAMGMPVQRPNRGDTGRNLWHDDGGIKNVRLAALLQDLAERGYHIVHTYFRSAPVRDHKTGNVRPGQKYVLRCIFDTEPRPNDAAFPMNIDQRLADYMSDRVWGVVEVWANQASDTVNVKQLARFDTPAGMLRFDPRPDNAPDTVENGVSIRGNFRFEDRRTIAR